AWGIDLREALRYLQDEETNMRADGVSRIACAVFYDESQDAFSLIIYHAPEKVIHYYTVTPISRDQAERLAAECEHIQWGETQSVFDSLMDAISQVFDANGRWY